MEIMQHSFICFRDGLRIRGMQYVPMDFDVNRRYPAVILSHGFLGNYTSMADFGRDFARAGFVAYTFSFCGSALPGEPEVVRSDGTSTDMTISTQVKDLAAVKEYAMQQPYADAGNLILVGVSQGGYVSGLAAAKYGEEVRKLVMIFPALCIPDDARNGKLGGSSYDPRQVPDRIDCGQIVLGKVFHEDVADRDPYQELCAYHGPVLILHGREDELVDMAYSVRARECYQDGQCQLSLIDNLGHGYDEKQRNDLFSAIINFYEEKGKTNMKEETSSSGDLEQKVLSVCGSDCGSCDCFGSLCKGCRQCEGKVFHQPEGTACAIYACTVSEKGFKHCGECAQMPCEIWMRVRDPKYSDEEFEENVRSRTEALRNC